MPLALSQLHGFNVLDEPRDPAWYIQVTTTAPSQNVSVSVAGNTGGLLIDWGDGTSNLYTTTGTKTRTYASAGTYVMAFSGVASRIDFYTGGTPLRVTGILNRVSGITGLTSFAQSFRGCTNLAGVLPQKLFDDCVGVTTFFETFYGCTNLELRIPFGLFAKCTSVTTFLSTFQGCTYEASVWTLPADMFGANTACNSCKWTFRNAKVALEIPGALFSGMPNVNTFEGCFTWDSGAKPTTAIGSGLFSAAPVVCSFVNCFYGQSNLTGNAPDIWTGRSDANGVNCFEACTSLANYASIPAAWK